MTPIEIQLKFGKGLEDDTINPSDVVTEELQQRFTKLLLGQFVMDEDDRCIIYPGPWKGETTRGDSVCAGLNLGPISISYCKELKK
jgi:hypothetical protein